VIKLIDTKIIKDSVNEFGDRVTTFLLKYPRYIHADFMTHRVFSRNASSSRARPSKAFITEALNECVMPSFWGKNQKGMQSFEEMDSKEIKKCKELWLKARDEVVKVAEELTNLGLHKQYVNRLLEPFTHITVICTATDYHNFFSLRAHKDAMPEIQDLAYDMLDLYLDNKPEQLKTGEWHLPFCDKYLAQFNYKNIKEHTEKMLKICTARCARVSYLNFDGGIDFQKDYVLHDDLVSSGHWSPFEHACVALDKSSRCGNLKGYKQYRKFFDKENILVADLPKIRRKKK
jgi:thymidylate synthase ThyX